MRKMWNFFKRCGKFTFIYLMILLLLGVLGILNIFIGFFNLFPAFNINIPFGAKTSSKYSDKEFSDTTQKDLAETSTPAIFLTSETPTSHSTIAPINTTTPELISDTSASTKTPSNTPTPPVNNFEVENTAQETAFEYTNGNTLAPDVATTPTSNINNNIYDDQTFSTPEVILHTLPPTPTQIIVTDYSKIIFVDFNDEHLNTLLTLGALQLPGVSITCTDQKIDISPDTEKTLVCFNLTKNGFAALHEAEIYSISIPYRNIPLDKIYKQLKETNTDIAEFKWFDDNSEYKCKAVIKKKFLDWLFRFPHGERYIIIE